MTPAFGTSFVGRAAELDELGRLLGTRPLVTVVGEGGVGKTRLAREVVDSFAAAEWPVWWVDLGAASSPAGVRSSFEDALRPIGPHATFETLVDERVPTGRCLLAIDNCEHVLDDVARRIEVLGAIRPEARILATSRTRLGVSGEVAYRLPPLPVPPPDGALAQIDDMPSAVLLVDRLRDVVTDFELGAENIADVVEIARRTEGVPLAIELVAAAAAVLPLPKIARDVPDSVGMGAADARREPRRHRSLDASARWSVDRLGPAASAAFRRLGAFADSFRFDSAVRVVSETGDRNDRSATRSFVELVEASLVRRLADDRYSLPMAVRTLAVEELEGGTEVATVRDRHADVIADLTLEAVEGLRAADEADDGRLRLLDEELPEVRAAIEWQLRRDRPGRAADLVLATYDHAQMRGRFGEVFAQCCTILSHPGLERADEARLSSTAAMVAVMAGRLADGHDLAVRALAASDDPIARVHAHVQRAWSGFYSGRIEGATLWADLDEAVRLARRHGDAELQDVALSRKGMVVVQVRSIAEGRALLTSVAQESDALPTHQLLAVRLFQVYGVTVFDLELDETYPQLVHLIDDCRTAGHVAYQSMALSTAATVAALWGEVAQADRYLDEAEQLTREHELPTFRNVAQRWRAFAHYRFERPDAAEQAERAIALAERTDNVWDVAASEWLLGLVHLRNADDRAVELLRSARDRSVDPGFPFSRIRAELALALVDLRDDEFATGLDRVHDALRRADEHGDLHGVASTLDHLARFECERSAFDRAARFAGAADAIHERARVERLPCERDLRAEVERRLVDALGTDEARRAVADGRALEPSAAVRLARRSRGRRSRPVSGWSSLTPTEVEVAGLAADGLSNPAIAERLVMSVNTVKTHLSHVYAKTGVEGRSGLAAEWARRSTDP